MIGLSNTTGLAYHHGKASRVESLRMGQGAGVGRSVSRHISRIDGCNDWPGKAYGIRRPDPAETAPSWEEVNHFFNTWPHA